MRSDITWSNRVVQRRLYVLLVLTDMPVNKQMLNRRIYNPNSLAHLLGWHYHRMHGQNIGKVNINDMSSDWYTPFMVKPIQALLGRSDAMNTSLLLVMSLLRIGPLAIGIPNWSYSSLFMSMTSNYVGLNLILNMAGG